MRKPIKSKKTAFKRYKKPLLLFVGALILLAYPLNLISENISASVTLDETLQAKQILNVDYNYDLEVYDNINKNTPVFSEIINKNIAEAQDSIYIAIYSFNIDSIRTSLFLAADRGVDVHLIYNYEDKEDFEEFLSYTSSFFHTTYLGDTRGDEYYYHMHHKFMIVDPGTDKEVLLTGPLNWSYYQEKSDINILLQIKDSEIIDSYLSEFKRLENGKGGVDKLGDWDYLPWEKEITYKNGDKVELWWSPGRFKNSVFSKIIILLDNAETSIDVGITLINSRNIARKLMEKANEGVKVRIIVDVNQIDRETSVIPWMREQIEIENIQNIEIFEGGKTPDEDTNVFSLFHCQNMIVDNKIVLTGTANWTSGGFSRNDENTLVFYSEKTAAQFGAIFEKYLIDLTAQTVD